MNPPSGLVLSTGIDPQKVLYMSCMTKTIYQPVPWCSGSIADFDRLVFQPLFVGICRSSVRIRQGSNRTTFCSREALSHCQALAGPSGNRNDERSKGMKVSSGFLGRHYLSGLAIGIHMTSCLVSFSRHLNDLFRAVLSDTNWKEAAGVRTVKTFLSFAKSIVMSHLFEAVSSRVSGWFYRGSHRRQEDRPQDGAVEPTDSRCQCMPRPIVQPTGPRSRNLQEKTTHLKFHLMYWGHPDGNHLHPADQCFGNPSYWLHLAQWHLSCPSTLVAIPPAHRAATRRHCT